MDVTFVKEIISAVSESNITVKRWTFRNCQRKTKKHLHVPFVPMLQKLLNNTDILDIAMSEKVHVTSTVKSLGASVKGSVLYVAGDNLAAHPLAGFLECLEILEILSSQ